MVAEQDVKTAELNQKSKQKKSNNKTGAAKRRNYKQELQEATKELEALKDQHLRTRAEFENYKKRRDKEVASFMQNANSQLLESLLPILDDFDRSFEAQMDDEERNDPFFQGIELMYQKFKGILTTAGVEAIECVGKPFDPEFHEALMQMESKQHPANTVLNEVVKGYKLRDKVLRYAKVVVSK
ncbi:nucleotide exchange factor GrpE [candidate division KSB1 bacterium]|nr:nucleotide exchange factor GrpE [candidate division KSB1 bacterium]